MMVSDSKMERLLTELAEIRVRLDAIERRLGSGWEPSEKERRIIMRRAKEAGEGDTIPLAEVKAKMKKTVSEPYLREIVDIYARVESIMATLETLEEPGVVVALEESRRMLAGGDFVECSGDEVDEVLR